MEAMDGVPLLGREVEIEFAKEPVSVYEREKHPHTVMTLVETTKDK